MQALSVRQSARSHPLRLSGEKHPKKPDCLLACAPSPPPEVVSAPSILQSLPLLLLRLLPLSLPQLSLLLPCRSLCICIFFSFYPSAPLPIQLLLSLLFLLSLPLLLSLLPLLSRILPLLSLLVFLLLLLPRSLLLPLFLPLGAIQANQVLEGRMLGKYISISVFEVRYPTCFVTVWAKAMF